jgi:hypothetical protein
LKQRWSGSLAERFTVSYSLKTCEKNHIEHLRQDETKGAGGQRTMPNAFAA